MCEALIREAFGDDADAVEMFWRQGADHHLTALVEHQDWPREAYALDLACAGGRNAGLLARRGFCVAAVDLDTARVRLTRHRLNTAGSGRNVCLRGTMLALPFEDSTFDLAVAIGAYTQVGSDSEFATALAENVRVLKPGGTLLAKLTYFFPTPDERALEPGCTFTYTTPEGPACMPTKEQWFDCCQAIGLTPLAPAEVRLGGEQNERTSIVGLFRRS
ncbi:MAG: class I SAM-dependent methyltransferase [bacterium]|nr:class I SAM-dependent methyltransferase [bacterium]